MISPRPPSAGVLEVGLSGEFDMSIGDALSSALREAARAPGVSRVVVDVQDTLLIDSHAIGGLVEGYEAAVAAGRTFVVVNAHGLVREVLDITGLSEVLCES